MISNDLVEYTKKNIATLDKVSDIEARYENDDKEFTIRFKFEGNVLLLKIQDESYEESKDEHVFSINYILRIKRENKNKKETDILKSINKFNERYAIAKCIHLKRDSETDTIWFRNESLTDIGTNQKLIINIIKTLISSPKLLMDIIRGQ